MTVRLGPPSRSRLPHRRSHRVVLSHARTEAVLLLRNGEQLLLALVIPAGILVVGRLAGGWFGGLEQLAPSVLALAVWSSAFTSLAIATGFERRYGVLERLACTPLGRGGLLAGKALATTAVVLGQLLILSGLALALGWRPEWTVLVSWSRSGRRSCWPERVFAGWALALAGRLRAELTLALANLIYVVLLVGGGLVVPLDRYPDRPAARDHRPAADGRARRSSCVRRPGRRARLAAARAGGLGPGAARGLAVAKGFRWTS